MSQRAIVMRECGIYIGDTMKIQQVAIFMENKPGHLGNTCRILADAGVSITTLSLADTQQYGILRLIIQDWEKAKKVLTDNGLIANITEVLAVEVEDKPGGLMRILDIVGKASVNIEYMYAFANRFGEKAIMVFRFDEPDKAIAALQKQDVRVLTSIDLFGGKS